ncbi:PLP-dependent cysteine synthase family protein [Seinonella peptonophila]|nr:cysteine synthase family protein [Seinonella peptonophila]
MSGQVYQGVKDLIGNTPVIQLNQMNLPASVQVYAKLEFMNPGGSIKDRLGAALIRAGEESGQLKLGGTIIEPTAGNTGIGLALAAIGTGYRVIFVVPEKFSIEKQKLMKALGAEVVNTPSQDGIKGAIAKAMELAKEMPDSYCPQQFQNPANPEVHYQVTGPEIWEQLEGKIDIFVAGAGSAGTFMGVARYLKEKNPQIRTVIVEPEGSILNGGEVGAHRTEGIGMEQIPKFFDWSLVDQVYTVTDQDAFTWVKKLAKHEGLLVGSSSGSAYHAVDIEARQDSTLHKKLTRIAVIFPDSSERYLSQSIYD